jgi:hypothetical protein
MDNIVTLKIIVDDKEGVAKLPIDTKLVNNLTKEVQQLEVQQKKTTGSSSNMNMAIMQMGYGIGDLSMITTNWRFALMGVGNNIPFVTQGIMAAKQEAKGLGVTFGQLAMNAIKGPGGIILAVNGLMLLLQVLPSLFGETTKAIKEQKEEVDKLRDSYSKLTKAEIENRITAYKSQLTELEAKYSRTSEMRQIGGIKSERFERVQLTDEERYGKEFERVNILKKQVTVLEELNRDLGIQEGHERNIRLNREKLNLMNENPESKNYWKNLVPSATDYNDAVKILNEWIKADGKLIKSGQEKIKIEKELFAIESKRNAAFIKISASGVYVNTNEANSPYGPASTGGAGQAITTVKKLIDYNEIYNDSLKQSAQNVGDVVSQWTLVRLGLGQANSLAQIFLSTMIQVAAQKLVVAGIEALFSGGTSILGSLFGAADGAIVTKPTFMMVGEGKEPEGVFPLSWLHQNMMNNKAQPIIVNLQGEAEVGLTKLHFRLKKVEDMIQAKY